MSFKVLTRDENGGPHRVLHEINDRRVTRVGLVTRTGEAGGARVDADMTEVLIEFEYAQQDGRPTLQDVEAQRGRTLTGDEAQERIDELAQLPTNSNSGLDLMLDASHKEAEERAEQERQAEQQVAAEDIGETAPELAPAEDAVDDGTASPPQEPPVDDTPEEPVVDETPEEPEPPADSDASNIDFKLTDPQPE